MDLVSMRAKFTKRGAAIGGTLSNTEIDEYLNAAYRCGVATGLSGSLSEGEWSFATVASTSEYDYDDEVYEVRQGARADGDLLSQYTRKARFDAEYSDTASEQKPYAVLFYGRTATLYPTPGDVYTITVPARMLPDADLAATGITDHNHAMAVICEAVVELAEDYQNAALTEANGKALDKYLKRLKRQSNSRVVSRRGGLSF